MTKKNCLPKDETEVLLHLVEEVGEVCEAIREKQLEKILKMKLLTFFGNLTNYAGFIKSI